MPHRFIAVWLAPIAAAAGAPMETPAIPLETARSYFDEAARLCENDAGRLWHLSLCGPMMFVEPGSRRIVANQQDPGRVLAAEGGVYVGTLPANENIANTAFTWSGVRWTQLSWPLPADPETRAVLLMHESYHRAQGTKGLPPPREADNSHLDTLEGRYSIQLEWRALARALAAPTHAAEREAMRDALLFRAHRHASFPASATHESLLELNEGLAEYTGVRLGLRDDDARTRAALRSLGAHAADPGFVRSFAYATGPAYGLLLDRWSPKWRTRLQNDSQFGQMLAAALGFEAAPELGAFEKRAASYDGAALHAAEVERDRRRRELLAQYRARFIEGPVLKLGFRNMKIQFDPRNLVALEGEGTVYPTLRVSDAWGVLDAKEGALLKPDWSAVSVPAPRALSGATLPGTALSGPGWSLRLNAGWSVVPGKRDGDFILAPPD